MPELDLDAIKARVEAASAGPWTAGDDGLVWAPRAGDPVSGSTEPEDTEFIAAARTDVPALVAEVERLRRVIAAVESITGDTDGGHLGPAEDIPVGELLRMLYDHPEADHA